MAAYLASALTGLSTEARRRVFLASDAVASVCEEEGVTLYQPRTQTDPVHNSEIADREVFATDVHRVLNADVLIFLADQPSTGSGQELVFAHQALVPIIVVASIDSPISRMTTGMLGADDVVLVYNGLENLQDELRLALRTMSPLGRRPARVRAITESHSIANRLRHIAGKHGVADVESLFPAEFQAVAFFDPTRIWNPTLLQLADIAARLEITLEELFGPPTSGEF